MKNLTKRIIWLSAPICLVLGVASTVAQTPAFKPKRINRAIELLEQGQPIYHTGSHEGTAGIYDQGVKDARTFAGYISYDMEHAGIAHRPSLSICRSTAPTKPRYTQTPVCSG